MCLPPFNFIYIFFTFVVSFSLLKHLQTFNYLFPYIFFTTCIFNNSFCYQEFYSLLYFVSSFSPFYFWFYLFIISVNFSFSLRSYYFTLLYFQSDFLHYFIFFRDVTTYYISTFTCFFCICFSNIFSLLYLLWFRHFLYVLIYY